MSFIFFSCGPKSYFSLFCNLIGYTSGRMVRASFESTMFLLLKKLKAVIFKTKWIQTTNETNSDNEHSESEFYYPTEHFTFAVPKRKEVLAPRSTMESPTSPEQFREIQNFIECQRPDNTSKKTTYDINVIERYFESINEKRNWKHTSQGTKYPAGKIFHECTQKNGDVYEPNSLKDYQRSLQRYLKDKSSQVNILQG